MSNDRRSDPMLPEGLRPDDGRLAPHEDVSGGQREPAIRTDGQAGRDNRGMRAPQTGSGVVIGSGTSAGGGGANQMRRSGGNPPFETPVAPDPQKATSMEQRMNPIPYRPDVEKVEPDEAETQQELIKTFRSIIETTHRDYGHGFRAVHAKSHALLEGEMRVLDDLPPEYAQGIFAEPRSHEVLLRISTNAGDPLPDSISLQRGIGIKVLGVEGERLPGSEGATTQDFVLANGVAFPAPGPKPFLMNLKALAATTDKVETTKKVVSAVFRTLEKGLEAVGGESAMLQQMGGYPNSHPLGERYFSQTPIRYGDYMAKVALVPLSANFKALEGEEIDIAGREDALREEIGDVLASRDGEWELRIQLCRDLEKNPIEDASVAWPEEGNPYVAVAVIRVTRQPSWTVERSRAVDDGIAFSPWHGVAAHRPLGALMRARKPAYEDSAGLRGRLNGCPIHEPVNANLPA